MEIQNKNERGFMEAFALKGNLCFSRDAKTLEIAENSYVVCENGICQGVFRELPEQYAGIFCEDYGDFLVIPGLVDLHLHAPQYAFRGLGMDMELLDWLDTHTFAEEQKYADIVYAKKAYEIFTEDLLHSATTRACIFGTIHVDATLLLMELLEHAGFCGYVGKVNMDRNSPAYLCEESAKASAEAAERWILACGGFRRVKPILTPRFIPSCSDELMERLSVLQKKYGLPVQSHLSENPSEIEWVKELCPNTEFYGEAYDQYGMFGNGGKTVMAHGVHSTQKELELMKKQGVFLAHCPQSNANLSSGIAGIRNCLEMGVKTGLGSDIAGGSSLSVFLAMTEAMQYSKLLWRFMEEKMHSGDAQADAEAIRNFAPLTMEEVFYMGTKGGGEFFGRVGSFEKGYEFDAVVLDDTSLKHPQPLSVKERLERFLYLSDDRNLAAKYIAGRKVFSLRKREN